jgi:hypothetical protein
VYRFDVPQKQPNRWNDVPKAERRRLMAEITKIRVDRAAARRLAQAVELVKNAGYGVVVASGDRHGEDQLQERES